MRAMPSTTPSPAPFEPARPEDASAQLTEWDPQRDRPLLSTELLRNRREVRIVHGSEEYRLRLTASGKLILTK